MKKKIWLNTLANADHTYVEEADPENTVLTRSIRRSVRRKRFAAIAACILCVLAIGGPALFFPARAEMQDVSRYSGSEYYGVIQKINAISAKKPLYRNNYAKLAAAYNCLRSRRNGIVDEMEGGGDGWQLDDWLGASNAAQREPENDTASDQISSEHYEETTDNQVKGVVEADLIKRSDRHIYYLDGNRLKIFTIEKENSKQIVAYDLSTFEKQRDAARMGLYLSNDCRTVTVISQFAGRDLRYVELRKLDVSNPHDIRERSVVRISGVYASSRMTDGRLLVFTNDSKADTPDFEDEKTYLPQIDDGNGWRSIPADHLLVPENAQTMVYQVVTLLDGESMEWQDSLAVLSADGPIYVTGDHIYLSGSYTKRVKEGLSVYYQEAYTDIFCLEDTDGQLKSMGAATVLGRLNNQYSMDEYQGILRVFTTSCLTECREIMIDLSDAERGTRLEETDYTNANLFCIDLSNWKIAAKVKNFADLNEQVKSVRYDGDAAYVCTAVEIKYTVTDPVFFFDLSDLSHITYKDTGIIAGFSHSLVELGDGYLLGLGTWGGRFFKAEIYEESEAGVDIVCSYPEPGMEWVAPTDYKAYLIDRKNRLIGVGIAAYDGSEDGVFRYVALHFDGQRLREVFNVPFGNAKAEQRGLYIDGYMYLFGREAFTVEPLAIPN